MPPRIEADPELACSAVPTSESIPVVSRRRSLSHDGAMQGKGTKGDGRAVVDLEFADQPSVVVRDVDVHEHP
jgi:hypothetical protein